MFILAHIAYPTLFFILISKLLHIGYTFYHILILFFFSILPDLDHFYLFIKKRIKDPNTQHRKWFTHWPITYTPLLVLFLIFPSIELLLACIGIFFHFVLDSFYAGEGVMWLFPFSRRFFNFFGGKTTGYHGSEWLKIYRKSRVYKLDILAFCILIIIFVF